MERVVRASSSPGKAHSLATPATPQLSPCGHSGSGPWRRARPPAAGHARKRRKGHRPDSRLLSRSNPSEPNRHLHGPHWKRRVPRKTPVKCKCPMGDRAPGRQSGARAAPPPVAMLPSPRRHPTPPKSPQPTPPVLTAQRPPISGSMGLGSSANECPRSPPAAPVFSTSPVSIHARSPPHPRLPPAGETNFFQIMWKPDSRLRHTSP